jgi:sec-independent protein translocase protein TatA
MFGSGELILIMGAILLLFGGKKLPEFARNLGKGIREFKQACNGEAESELPLASEEMIVHSDTEKHDTRES